MNNKSFSILKKSLVDKKNIRYFYAGEKMGSIFVFDENRNVDNEYQYIGCVNNYIITSNDENIFNKELLNNIISDLNSIDVDYIDLSLIEFKSIFNGFIELSQPEKFGQLFIATVYNKDKGWKQEYLINNEYRADLAYIQRISATNECCCMLIENKNVNLIHDNNFNNKKNENEYLLRQKEAINQLNDYAKAIHQKSIDKNEELYNIIAKIFIYDGNYLFNNPEVLNQIEYLMKEDSKFFKSYSYIYTKNDDELEYSWKLIYNKGIMDIIKIEEYYIDSDGDLSWAQVKAENFNKINRSSNPRELEERKSLSLALSIVKDMKYDIINNGKKYKANKYTNQKQLSVSSNIFNLCKGKNRFLFGHNLSLNNGQHSCVAYNYIIDIVKNRISFNHNQNNLILSDLRNEIEMLLHEIEVNGLSFDECVDLNLSVKIVSSFCREDENKLAISSNTTVGIVDTRLHLILPFLLKINNDLLSIVKNDDVLKLNKIPQICLPRIDKISLAYYLPYDLIMLLYDLSCKPKNPLSIFRSSPGKASLTKFLSFLLKKENKETLNSLQKQIDKVDMKIEKELNGEIIANQDKLLIEKKLLCDKYNKLYNMGIMENINDDSYNEILSMMITFNNIYIKSNHLGFNYERDNKFLIQKLAFGLIYSFISKYKNLNINNNLISKSLIVANIINNHIDKISDFSLKNEAYNVANNSSIIIRIAFDLMEDNSIIDMSMDKLILKAKEMFNQLNLNTGE